MKFANFWNRLTFFTCFFSFHILFFSDEEILDSERPPPPLLTKTFFSENLIVPVTGVCGGDALPFLYHWNRQFCRKSLNLSAPWNPSTLSSTWPDVWIVLFWLLFFCKHFVFCVCTYLGRESQNLLDGKSINNSLSVIAYHPCLKFASTCSPLVWIGMETAKTN